MAEAFEEPYHVPQQSRRVKLREGCASLVLPSSDLLTCAIDPTQLREGFHPNPFLSLSSHQSYVASSSSSGGPVRSSVPLGPFTGYASVLKGSRFLRPAQQMMEEMCDVARCGVYDVEGEGDVDLGGGDDVAAGVAGSGTKSRLVSMLDEVYKRYKYYYQQMQAVVASFESVPGLSNAAPFANLALKAMSRHFRALKAAIIDQLRFGNKSNYQNSRKCETNSVFGDSDNNIIHFGQRSVQNMGLHDNQPVWRPQRGLPERAVTMLRAWLFDHFLHPYPTDTDKMMLAKQTGLSRNQVSNWFINARVRLWKPMVEEIHNLETRQAQKSSQQNDQNTDIPNNNFSTTTSLVSQYPSTTFASKTLELPSKRAKNEFRGIASNVTEESMCTYYEHLSNHQVLVGGGSGTPSGNISLTLGLHQNHGIGISEPFPINAARRFGLDANTQGYVLGNFEAQNREFGRDVINGQLFHDFVG